MKTNVDKYQKVILNQKKLEEFIANQRLECKFTPKSMVFTCPICNKRDKLYMYRASGHFTCWVCKDSNGFSGRPEAALSRMTGMKPWEVRKLIYDGLNTGAEVSRQMGSFDFDLTGPQEEEIQEVDMSGWPDHAWPLHCYPIEAPAAAAGAAYLAGRGIPVEIAQQYQIRYNTHDKTVDFPVYVGERLVGWQSRKTYEGFFYKKSDVDKQFPKPLPKIISTPDIPRSHVFMFENRITSNKCVITEGPVDAIKCHLFGGNIAAMGKSISDGQLDRLYQKGVDSVFIGLDPDAASGVNELAQRIQARNMQSYLITIPDHYKDLGEMSFEEAYNCICSAEEFFPYQKLQLLF